MRRGLNTPSRVHYLFCGLSAELRAWVPSLNCSESECAHYSSCLLLCCNAPVWCSSTAAVRVFFLVANQEVYAIMASKGIDSNTSRFALLPPTLARDNLGVYISISCGKVSGQLYLSKMSKKSPGKCVLVSGQWYSPLEVESLGGRRAKKWKQSLHHLRKPLADYDLSCFDLATGTGASLSTGLVTDLSSSSVQLSGDAVFPCNSQVQSGGTDSGSVSMSSPCSCTRPLLVDVVLSFVKAYRLKSDKESLTSVVTERFSAKEVEAAKGSLWEYCKVDLEAMDLVFHVRRDSDRRSQLAANLEDILQMFEALEKIPHIHCEAFDLLRLPPLSLDPVAEQVQSNSQTLKSLASVIEKLENKLSSGYVLYIRSSLPLCSCSIFTLERVSIWPRLVISMKTEPGGCPFSTWLPSCC